jgi:hypothetical protein
MLTISDAEIIKGVIALDPEHEGFLNCRFVQTELFWKPDTPKPDYEVFRNCYFYDCRLHGFPEGVLHTGDNILDMRSK